jgi:transposase-like protein
LDVLPELIRVILITVMQAVGEQHKNAEPYQRTSEREPLANGFKPKIMRKRVGDITFSFPQVREEDYTLFLCLRQKQSLVFNK